MSKWLNWTPGRLSEEPSKLQNSNSDGFDGASIEKSQKIEFHFDGADGISGGASQNITFPRCPRCGSFALYRRNGQGEIWHVHRKTVHRMFDGVPGVLEFGEDGHRSRRIPESVMLLRVHRDRRPKS